MSSNLASCIAEYDRRALEATRAITAPRPDHTTGTNGAYSAIETAKGNTAQPFFEDMNIVLSRPAHLRDYQADSSAYPYRSMRPDELGPVVPKPPVVPEMPKMVFTSEAEQKWLQQRDQDSRSAFVAAEAELGRKDYSKPPEPFVSKLGFRQPEPFPPMPPPIKDFCHQDGVSNEFFFGGTGRFVSENGVSNSQMYYKLARPLGGRLKSHYVSETTPYGYAFDQYTSRP